MMSLNEDISKVDYYINNGNFNQAKIILINFLRTDKNNIDALMLKAFCCLNLGEYTEAINTYDRILDIKITPDALNNKGHVYNEIHDPVTALRIFERCNNLFPFYEIAWSNKGRALAALGRYEEAKEAYEHALLLTPGLQDAIVGLNYVTDILENQQTIQQNNLNFNEDFNNPEVMNFYIQGLNYLEQGDYDSAISSFEFGLNIEPQNIDLLSKKAFAYHQKAISFLNSGLAFEAKGYYEECVKFYDEILKINFLNFDAINGKLYCYRDIANCYMNLNQYSEAYPYYEIYADFVKANYNLNKTHEVFTSDMVDALCTKGMILSIIGKKEEAILALDEAWEIFPSEKISDMKNDILTQNNRTGLNTLTKIEQNTENNSSINENTINEEDTFNDIYIYSDTPLECPKCERKVTKTALEVHKKCPHCSYKPNKISEFIKKEKTENLDKTNWTECPKCGKKISPIALDIHKKCPHCSYEFKELENKTLSNNPKLRERQLELAEKYNKDKSLKSKMKRFFG